MKQSKTISGMDLKISVVIPAYKARNYLKEALVGVFAQTLLPCEILVIDDKSPEPVDDIIREVQNTCRDVPIKLIVHSKNQGLGASRNTGITQALGDYVAFLDHDDFWDRSHLQNVSDCLLRSGSDWGFSASYLFFDDSGQKKFWGPDESDDLRNLIFSVYRRCFIVPSSVVIKKSTATSVGMFSTNPRVHYCEDLDFWIRLCLAGKSFCYSSDPTTFYRKHPEAATQRLGLMAEQDARVKTMYFSKIPAPWGLKRTILGESYWSAAIQLKKIKHPRHFTLLLNALYWSLHNPVLLIKRLVRYLKVAFRVSKSD